MKHHWGNNPGCESCMCDIKKEQRTLEFYEVKCHETDTSKGKR